METFCVGFWFFTLAMLALTSDREWVATIRRACSARAGAADDRDGASASVGAASCELALRLAARQLAVAFPLPELGILGTGMLTCPAGKLLAIISSDMATEGSAEGSARAYRAGPAAARSHGAYRLQAKSL